MTEEQVLSFDITQIMEMIPHRYPFLLVDKITECIPKKYSKGYKNLTMNEAFFQGHFPGNPVMPGVLQLEALAQMSSSILTTIPEYQDKLFLFVAIDGVRFRKQVRPGDRLDMESELTKLKGPLAKVHAKGFVDGQLAVEADLMVSMVDKK